MTIPHPTENTLALPRIYAWFSALVFDDYPLMEDLLLHGIPIDVPHPLRHTTALMEATRLGRTELVAWLLNHGAAPALLNGLPQGTALHCAIRRHHWDIAHILMKACSSMNDTDAYGNTPLHLTCANPLEYNATLHMMDIINMLVGRGCHLDSQNKEGVTALHYTVINDNPTLTELLLVHGANPNMQTPEILTTPLMIAALEQNITMAALLLQHGADPHLRNHEGTSSADMLPGIWRLAEQTAGSYVEGDVRGSHAASPTNRMN